MTVIIIIIIIILMMIIIINIIIWCVGSKHMESCKIWICDSW